MITETIFSSDTLVIPLADVQHIEKLSHKDLWVITCHTNWNFEKDTWDNPIYVPERLAESFLAAWCRYRHEKDIQPDPERMKKAIIWALQAIGEEESPKLVQELRESIKS